MSALRRVGTVPITARARRRRPCSAGRHPRRSLLPRRLRASRCSRDRIEQPFWLPRHSCPSRGSAAPRRAAPPRIRLRDRYRTSSCTAGSTARPNRSRNRRSLNRRRKCSKRSCLPVTEPGNLPTSTGVAAIVGTRWLLLRHCTWPGACPGESCSFTFATASHSTRSVDISASRKVFRA